MSYNDNSITASLLVYFFFSIYLDPSDKSGVWSRLIYVRTLTSHRHNEPGVSLFLETNKTACNMCYRLTRYAAQMLSFQYTPAMIVLQARDYDTGNGTAESTSKTMSPFVHDVAGLIRYEFSILCCLIGLLPSASCSFTTCLGLFLHKQSNCTQI